MSHLFYFRDGSVVHPRETKTTSAIHKTVFLTNIKEQIHNHLIKWFEFVEKN